MTISLVSTSIPAKLALLPSSLLESLIHSPTSPHKLVNSPVYTTGCDRGGRTKKKSSR